MADTPKYPGLDSGSDPELGPFSNGSSDFYQPSSEEDEESNSDDSICDKPHQRVYLILLVVALTRCRCDHTTTFSSSSASQFGELLKPPPPPLSQIQPVPFHGGARTQRQNLDAGYQYQPPPPPPPPPQISNIPFPSDFKFPAPFYKQYNFNFVPPPQPFSTTPSPSLFQKVSTWLFPSQQTSYEAGLSSSNLVSVKKDCNPCNLVPWIPVLRYNLGAKNIYQNSNPTYGPPSPTALAENIEKFQPQPFNPIKQTKFPQLAPGLPHALYGPPIQTFNSNAGGGISSTYGPPSPTHTYGLPSANPISSTFVASSSPYAIPSTTYGVPSSSYGQPSSSYLPSPVVSTPLNIPTTTYRPQTLYTTPIPSYGAPLPATTYGPLVTSFYEPGVVNNNLLPSNDVEILNDSGISAQQKLPNVGPPTGFKNSYGEPISNTYGLDIPYPVSATAAESTKIKTEVLPSNTKKPFTPNVSLAVGNPAPFSLNRGRNIHTLQPVALPNLSVSPLPPIFNARPFRPIATQFPSTILQGVNQMQQQLNNVDISQSVPLVEFTHSIDYPATFIQSPVIDVDVSRINNQTKAYRNIPNHFVIDQVRDISSQASEDHLSATKTIPDSSFESTGLDGNDIYDSSIPSDLRESSYVPSNHKPNFADLRGLKDEDVDKYRTETNLQNIDSPLLYLRPSAPHKTFKDFVLAVSTPGHDNEFEIYDDIPSTVSPQIPPSLPSAWDESRNDYSEGLSPPSSFNKGYQPKIVQIIVPYTTENKEESSVAWSRPENENQPRKVPSNTESPYSQYTEIYSTTTEEPLPTVTESYDSEKLSAEAILNDLYDVKDPPFDIIKLQHTIDDWTEQEYAKYKPPQKTRSSEKHAKKIPDEYFTTTVPTNFATDNNYYDIFDHEGSSSIHHLVAKENDNPYTSFKQYNYIDRPQHKHESAKNEENDQNKKLHIYTAASYFRTTTTPKPMTMTTTPAPWGKIQTSISPLTKEKIYVVTSKPWREIRNTTKEWYEVKPFELNRTKSDTTTSDSLHFKSPRFMNRPSFGFTSGGKVESLKSDSSYGFSRSWYQSINELENNRTLLEDHRVTTSSDEITTSNRHKY